MASLLVVKSVPHRTVMRAKPSLPRRMTAVERERNRLLSIPGGVLTGGHGDGADWKLMDHAIWQRTGKAATSMTIKTQDRGGKE